MLKGLFLFLAFAMAAFAARNLMRGDLIVGGVELVATGAWLYLFSAQSKSTEV